MNRLTDRSFGETNFIPSRITSTLSENELVRLAQAGDKEAGEVLVNRHYKAAIWTLPKYARNNSEAVANAMVECWKAITNHDPNRGAKLNTFIARYVRNGFLNNLKHQNAKKRSPPRTILEDSFGPDSEERPIDTYNPESLQMGPTCFKNPTELAAESDELRYMHKLIGRATLSKTKKNILNFFLRGLDHVKISEILGITHGSVRTLFGDAINDLRELRNLENEIKGFFHGRDSSPIPYSRGPERLKKQRAIFGLLCENIEMPREKISRELLQKFNLYPANGFRTGVNKAQAINRLLASGEKLPLACISGIKKWEGPGAKERAFDTLEYMINNRAYIINGAPDTYQRVPWLRGMMSRLYGDRNDEANEEFQIERLELDNKQKRNLFLLAHVADNRSCILNGTYQNAAEKVRGHLEILEKIADEAPLTDRQRKVYDLWLRGFGWEEIVGALPEEFNKSLELNKITAKNEIGFVKHKLRVQAIKSFQKEFEADADYEVIKRETRSIFDKREPLTSQNMYDQYFRLRLQTYLREIANNKGWALGSVPCPVTQNNTSRRLLGIFDNSVYKMIDFAFPGMYNELDFITRGKWDGPDAREKGFQSLDRFLRKENSLMLSRTDYRKHFQSTIDSAFGGSRVEANRDYVEEYLRKQLDLDDEQFSTYVTNRKFLSILFEPAGPKPRKKPKFTDEGIAALNRQEIYKMAGLSPAKQEEWESRISLWDYHPRNLKHKEVQEITGSGYNAVRKNLSLNREKLVGAVLRVYGKVT